MSALPSASCWRVADLMGGDRHRGDRWLAGDRLRQRSERSRGSKWSDRSPGTTLMARDRVAAGPVAEPGAVAQELGDLGAGEARRVGDAAPRAIGRADVQLGAARDDEVATMKTDESGSKNTGGSWSALCPASYVDSDAPAPGISPAAAPRRPPC